MPRQDVMRRGNASRSGFWFDDSVVQTADDRALAMNWRVGVLRGIARLVVVLCAAVTAVG
jgi:hypothetical protein